MKSNTKKILVLIVLGMSFVFLPNIKFDFSVEQTTFNKLKNSSVYYGSIHIDALATTNTTYSGNWTWAVSQPWCYNDNGVYIIEDLTINASTSPTGNGIYIENSKNEYFIIRNCTVYSAKFQISIEAGIKLRNVNNGTLINNNCSNNLVYGISLLDECNNNTISGNIASDNGMSGIILYGLGGNCQNNTISGNTANNNNQNGIRVSYNYNYNKITGNTAKNNNRNGIFLSGDSVHYPTNWNQITNNIIINNQEYGIDIEWCNNNSIYKNFFLENEKHAVDYGTDNKWNSTTIGNYWDNWTSPDANNDGIVDVPYNISLSPLIQDHLPIAEDGAPRITIDSPSEGDAFSLVAPNYSITVTDDYLDTMWYTLDGGTNNYTCTENGMINQSAWDALDDGAITLAFFAKDIPDYTGSASVGIIKDTVTPIIIINSPAEGDRFGTNAPLFNITVTEDNLDTKWYSFDGGLTTYAITNNTVFNQTAWTELSEGDVTITFYAQDLAGNEASESVTVIKSIPSGLDPGVIITIIIVSIVGGVAAISVVYIFVRKRVRPA